MECIGGGWGGHTFTSTSFLANSIYNISPGTDGVYALVRINTVDIVENTITVTVGNCG